MFLFPVYSDRIMTIVNRRLTYGYQTVKDLY